MTKPGNFCLKTTERTQTRAVFGLFGLLMLVYFLAVPAPLGDDLWFMEVSSPIGEFVAFRYRYWSSRCLLEGLLLALCRLPLVVTRVVMAGVAALGTVVLHRLFTDRSPRSAAVVCAVFLLFASYGGDLDNRYFTLLTHTGLLATTVNYLLPAVCGLVALLPLQKAAQGERLRWFEWILYPLCAVIGAGQEQMCAILAVVYLLFGGYFLYKKRFHPILAAQLALAAASLVFTLTCPGNASRLVEETATWNPAFAEYGLLQKLDIGVSSLLEFFFATTPLVLLLELFLAVVIFQKYESAFCRAIGVAPLAVSLAFGPLAGLTDQLFPQLAAVFGRADYAGGWLNLTGSPTLAPPAKFVVGCMTVAALCTGVYLAFGHRMKSLVMLTVFAAGAVSRVVIGFSPTIVASGCRTAFFFLLALSALVAALYTELRETGGEKAAARCLALCCGLGALGYLTMLLPVFGI